MATQHYTGKAQAFPLALIGQAVGKLSRHELEALTERLLERLDEVEGDPDLEDALDTEDDVLTPWGAVFHDGPGCPIADAGGQCDEDEANTGLRALYEHGRAYNGPGCPLADEDVSMVPAEGFPPV